MVPDLPDQVGQEQRHRDGAGNPYPGLQKFSPQRRQQKREGNRESEEQRGMFILQSQPGQDAEPHPQARIAGAENAQDDQRAAHPEQRLDCVHGEEAVFHQQAGAHQDRQTGEELGVASAAELARNQHGERHQGRARQRRNDAQRRQRASQQQRNLGVNGDQRGGVYVAPIEMARHVEVVEFVAEVAVMPNAGENMQQELGRTEADHNRGGEAGWTHAASGT